jgi:transcriptional regulator with XRE-family HTH domain
MSALTAEVAAELRAEMARQKVSAREVSRRTGVPKSTLSRWLNGEGLGFDEYDVIMRALGKEPASSRELTGRWLADSDAIAVAA